MCTAVGFLPEVERTFAWIDSLRITERDKIEQVIAMRAAGQPVSLTDCTIARRNISPSTAQIAIVDDKGNIGVTCTPR